LIPVIQSMRHTYVMGPVSGVSVSAVEPVAHVRKEFEVSGVRLAEYEVRR
jgi:hypothetical protein